MNPLIHLQQRAAEPWLIGLHPQQLLESATQRLQGLSQLQAQLQLLTSHPTVLLAAADPTQFLAGLIAACTLNCPVFLGNPHWTASEWQQVLTLAQPHLIWAEGAASLPLPASYSRPGSLAECSRQSVPRGDLAGETAQPGWIMIPTGGTSGQIRFAVHTWQTLTAAVTGFQTYFQVDQINSCCILPLYHVSGLMQFMRSFVSGGQFACLPSKGIEQHCGAINPADFFLSLVPTQLQRWLGAPQTSEHLLEHLLEHPPENIARLAQFHTVFLGGAPAWTELCTLARRQKIRLAPTYGMTETAAQVATLKPEQFLEGMTGVGQPLPHAQIKIRPPEAAAPDSAGTLVIQSQSLMLGYFPPVLSLQEFETDDLGFWDGQGGLQIVGRNSQKIITGGENVFPAEVEAAIRSTGLVRDVCVIGMPDQTWGEVVTAVYMPDAIRFDLQQLQAAISLNLSKFKQPKQWIEVEYLPRNVQGKINYEHLRQIL